MLEGADKRRRASVHTLGCRLNQAESTLLVDLLEGAGYAIVPFGDPADLGVVNTCTVTHEADAKCRQLIRSFIRKNPDAYVAVVGCYSELRHKALAKISGIDLILGTQDKLDLLDYVRTTKNDEPLVVRSTITDDSFSIDSVGKGTVLRRVNLKIQDGCGSMCSYCVIPLARGHPRSRDMDNLLSEAEQLVRRGAKEIVLTGLNVGRYAYRGQTILDVVDGLNEIGGLRRVRISSIEPTTIPEDLFARMDDEGHALVPHLHIPLQSGSDRVLALMNRRYTSGEYGAFLSRAAEAVRDLRIGTDVLVGVPGETDEDFSETVRVVRDCALSYAHVFKYSARQGTVAADHPNKVDPVVRNRRSAVIRRISAEKDRAFAESFLGRRLDVLFEQEEDGFWVGYTGNYLRVAVRSSEALRNEIRRVRMDAMRGEIVEGTLDDDRS